MDDGVNGAGSGGRRYCRGSTGVLMCICGVDEVGSVVVTGVGYAWWRQKALRSFPAAGERRSELAGGPGLAGESFWIKTEWCRLGGGGKYVTDCGESSRGVVVKVVIFIWAEI